MQDFGVSLFLEPWLFVLFLSGLCAFAGLAVLVTLSHRLHLLRIYRDVFLFASGTAGYAIALKIMPEAQSVLFQPLLARLFLFLSFAVIINTVILIIARLFVFMSGRAEDIILLIAQILTVPLILIVLVGVMMDRPIAEILGVSAVGLGAIGLAAKGGIVTLLQSLIVNLNRNININDWINVGGTVGQVTSIGVYQIVLRTPKKQIVVMPIGYVFKSIIENYSRPDLKSKQQVKPIGTEILISLGYEMTPEDVGKFIEQFMTSGNESVDRYLAKSEDPPYVFIIDGFGDFSINYRIRVYLKSYELRVRAKNAIQAALFEYLKERNIVIPYPIITHKPTPEAVGTRFQADGGDV